MHRKFTEKRKESLRVKLDSLLDETTTSENEEGIPEIIAAVAGVTDARADIYLEGKGVRDSVKGIPIQRDDVFAYFSCTKSLTCMGLLILSEQGKVNIDAPVKNYVPEIESIGLIDEDQVDDNGEFKYPPRKPKTEVTLKHLLTHTSGFSYAFMSNEYSLLTFQKNPHVNAVTPSDQLFTTEKMPLLFEPGTNWMYGHSTDWVGRVIEHVSGLSLGEFLKKEIFTPVGMTSCTFHLKDSSRLVQMHRRTSDGVCKPMRNIGVKLDPEVDMGGQGCFGSVSDYLKFIRVWLNYGYSPDAKARILKQETVNFAIQNHLPEGLHVTFETAMSYSLPPEFVPDTFTLTGNAYTMNNFPTGRPKGALYWAGLANLYYWIDIKNQVGGFWGSQLFPYMDPKVLTAYIRFEHDTYESLNEYDGNQNNNTSTKL